MKSLTVDTTTNVKVFVNEKIMVFKVPTGNDISRLIPRALQCLGVDYDLEEFFCVDEGIYFTNIQVGFTNKWNFEYKTILADSVLELGKKLLEMDKLMSVPKVQEQVNLTSSTKIADLDILRKILIDQVAYHKSYGELPELFTADDAESRNLVIITREGEIVINYRDDILERQRDLDRYNKLRAHIRASMKVA